jgi:hypothetical protein
LKVPAPRTEPVVDKVITSDVSWIDDKTIRQRLREICTEPERMRTIDGAVDGGVVTLEGTVDSATTADDAAHFAQQVQGVFAVESQLQVERDLGKRLSETWAQVAEVAHGLRTSLPLMLLYNCRPRCVFLADEAPSLQVDVPTGGKTARRDKDGLISLCHEEDK